MWQPISEAPRDGTIHLVCRMDEDGCYIHYPTSAYYHGDDECWVEEETDSDIVPTHFQPLPSPVCGETVTTNTKLSDIRGTCQPGDLLLPTETVELDAAKCAPGAVWKWADTEGSKLCKSFSHVEAIITLLAWAKAET
jgi:hypothetical protein